MRKNFLLLLLMTLLPLAGWAQTNLADGWEIQFTPESPVYYTGDNLLPTVSLKKGNSTIESSDFKVVWKNENGVVVTEAKNAGWYEATVTADMNHTYGDLATPTKKFYILKATNAISGGVMMTNTDYDGQEHELVTTKPTANFGDIEYSIDQTNWSAQVPKAKKVGSYTVYARVQESNNWVAATKTIGSASIIGTDVEADDITAPTAKTGLMFANADLALIDAGAIVNDDAVKELQYKVGSGAWSTAIPTAKNAGTYNVSYKAVGKDGYNDYVATSTVDVTIAPAAPTLTAPVGASLTYTGQAQNLIATAATATLGAPVKYIVNFKAANAADYAGWSDPAATAKRTDAGTYKVKAVVEAVLGGNYTYAESTEIEVKLAQANAFANDANKPKAADLTWNNAAQQLIAATPVKAGIVDYRFEGGSWGSTDITAMKKDNAGIYTVEYRVNNPNYVGYDVTNTVNCAIKKKVLSVKVDDIKKTYNGNTTISPATAPGYTFIGRVENTLNFSGIALSATTKVNVGEYANELTVDVDALKGVSTNYEYVIIPGKLTIKPVEVTITAITGLHITYGENPNIGDKYTWSTLVTGEDLDDVFETGKRPVLTTNAAANKPSIGTYTLSFTPGVLKNGGNYVMSTAGEKGNGYVIGAANFVVNPEADQKIVITVLPQTHTYTGVAEDFSKMKAGKDYYVSGLLDNDQLSKAPTFSRSNPGTFNVGTYDLIASGAEISAEIANKYPGGIVYNNSTLEITKKELVAKVNTQTVQKDAPVEALNQDAWSVEGLENGEAKSVLGGSLALNGSTATENVEIADGIKLTITNANYTLKAGTQFGKLIVIPANTLYLSDDLNDNFTKIKTFDGNTGKNVQVVLSNREQEIGSSTFTWGAKEYQILVLPFEVTVSEISSKLGYAVVNVVNKAKATATEIYWSLEWGTIPANTPFTVRTAEAIPDGGKTLNFTGKTIVAPETAYPSVDAGNGFKVVGAYEAYTIDKSSASKERFYAGGKHYGIGESSTNTWTINPFNGYVDLSGSAAAPESVTFTFENVGGGTTAIRSITAENAGNATEGWYTLNGVKLQGAPVEKGVYIKNGKKIVIK